MPKLMPGMDMMDTTTLTRFLAPQQVQQNQTLSSVSLGTGVVGHSYCPKRDEGKDCSWAAESERAPKGWALMPPVQPSWYQSG